MSNNAIDEEHESPSTNAKKEEEEADPPSLQKTTSVVTLEEDGHVVDDERPVASVSIPTPNDGDRNGGERELPPRRRRHSSNRRWLAIGVSVWVLAAVGASVYFGISQLRRPSGDGTSFATGAEDGATIADDENDDDGAADNATFAASLNATESSPPSPSPSPSSSSTTTPSAAATLSFSPTASSSPTGSSEPTPAPTAPGTRSPTFPTDAYWRQMSPRLHEGSYGHSVSLSADGRRLAVLHADGFDVHDNQGLSTTIWTSSSLSNGGVSERELARDLGLPEDVFDDGRSVAAGVELNLAGDRLLVHASRVVGGRAAVYRRDDTDGAWRVVGPPLDAGAPPLVGLDGALRDDPVAYARGRGHRVLAASVVWELDDGTGQWSPVRDDLRDAVDGDGGPTDLLDEVVDILQEVTENVLGFGNDAAVDVHGGLFGTSVAISTDGDRVAVASPLVGGGEGRIFAFEDADFLFGLYPYWRQRGQALSSGYLGDENDRIGTIAMSNNGDRVAVGTPGRGTVHIFGYTAAKRQWRVVGTIREHDDEERDRSNNNNNDEDGDGDEGPPTRFGQAITLSENGSWLAVLAPEKREGGRICMYAFVNEKFSLWEQVGNCLAPGYTRNSFRISMSFSFDGTRIAVGVPENDDYYGEDNANQNDDYWEGEEVVGQWGHVTVYELSSL